MEISIKKLGLIIGICIVIAIVLTIGFLAVYYIQEEQDSLYREIQRMNEQEIKTLRLELDWQTVEIAKLKEAIEQRKKEVETDVSELEQISKAIEELEHGK